MMPRPRFPSNPVEVGDYNARYSCGCSSTRGVIDLCDMHYAAPVLLEAAEEVLGPDGVRALVHLELAVLRAKGVDGI